jgi:hypothetical protein
MPPPPSQPARHLLSLVSLSAIGVVGVNEYPSIAIGKGVVSGTYIAKGGGGTARYGCV